MIGPPDLKGWGLHPGAGTINQKRRVCMAQSNAERNRKNYERRKERHGAFANQFRLNKKTILATESVCAICGGFVDKTLPPLHPMAPTIDHIIPISLGGHPSSMDNLQLTHRKCNRAKGAKAFYEAPKQEPKENVFVWSHDWKND